MAIKTAGDVMKFAKDNKTEIVDLKFCDVPGLWQHFSVSANEFGEDVFEDGIGFDGSSIRGYQQIHESDMLLVADPETAYVDPNLEIPTLSLICNVQDPITRQPYSRDPRYIAQKAELYLKGGDFADVSHWGPELEFYIFDDVRYDQTAQSGYYFIDSKRRLEHWPGGPSSLFSFLPSLPACFMQEPLVFLSHQSPCSLELSVSSLSENHPRSHGWPVLL